MLTDLCTSFCLNLLTIRVIHDFIGETAENRSDYVIHNGKPSPEALKLVS